MKSAEADFIVCLFSSHGGNQLKNPARRLEEACGACFRAPLAQSQPSSIGK